MGAHLVKWGALSKIKCPKWNALMHWVHLSRTKHSSAQLFVKRSGCAYSMMDKKLGNIQGSGRLLTVGGLGIFGPRSGKKTSTPLSMPGEKFDPLLEYEKKTSTPSFYEKKTSTPPTLISQPPLPVINDHSLKTCTARPGFSIAFPGGMVRTETYYSTGLVLTRSPDCPPLLPPNLPPGLCKRLYHKNSWRVTFKAWFGNISPGKKVHHLHYGQMQPRWNKM